MKLLQRLIRSSSLRLLQRGITSFANQTKQGVADDDTPLSTGRSLKQISRALTSCRYVSDFQYLLEQEKGNLSAVHMSVGLTQLSKILINTTRLQQDGSQIMQQGLGIICTFCEGLNTNIDLLSTQSVANSIWALTNILLNLQSQLDSHTKTTIRKTCDILFQRTSQTGDQMNSHDLANMLWSIARTRKMQGSNEQVIQKLTDRCLTVEANDFRPQGLANIMWALSTLNVNNKKIAKRFASIAVSLMDDFSVQEICNLLWGLQKMRWKDLGLLQSVEQSILKYGVSEVKSPVDISTLLLSFSQFRFHSRLVMEMLVNQFCNLINEYSSEISNNHFRAGANSIYALAVLNAPIDYANNVLATITSKYSFDTVDAIQAQQLYLAYILYDAQGEELKLSRQQLKYGQNVRRQFVKQGLERRKSRMHDEVVKELRALNFQFETSCLELDGDIEVGIKLLGLDREKVAVWTLEPSCCTSSPDQQILGNIEAHVELLEANGWSIVLVPHFEWNRYRTSNTKQGYLSRRLQKIL